MNGDDPYATDWISALTPEERRKLIFLTSEMFALALSSPTAAMSLIGAGNKVAVARTVQPIMAMNPSGKLVPLINSSNVLPVTEASGAAILGGVQIGYASTKVTSPLPFLPDGTDVANQYGAIAWKPIKPVTVTAGAGGDVGAAVIIAAVAAKYLDVMLFWKVRTVAGATQYAFKFATDPGGGAEAVVTPDWYTSAITIPHAANESWPPNPFGERMQTTVVNKTFGIPALGAGSWPNNAAVTFGGFYRSFA